MIRRFMIAAAATAMLVVSTGAAAQEVESKPIEEKNLDSGKITLQAEKAYIFISGPNRTNGIFLKTPDAEDLEEYNAEWVKELEDAKKKYPGRVRRYESKLKVWKAAPKGAAPEAPEAPTEENFSIGDIQRRMIVSFGPQFVYGKGQDEAGEKSFSYLIEVEPGTYSYYGPMIYIPGAVPMGTCYCMGSVKFEASAGKVTSLGDFLHFQWVSDEAARQSSVAIDPDFKRIPKPVDFSVPARLAEFGAEPADLRASGKVNNFFGVMVGRMPPVEGVLAYDRDIPIDVKGQLAAKAVEDAAAAAAAAADAVDDAADDVSEEIMEAAE